MPVISTAPPTPRKKLLKRAAPDRSQLLRHGFQLAFLALNVWIATEFYLFVRYYERGGAGPHVGRPPGVEGWLPIASLMNLKVLLGMYQDDTRLKQLAAGISLVQAPCSCSPTRPTSWFPSAPPAS